MPSDNRHIEMPLASGGVLRVEPIAEHTFRIRLSPDGRFREPLLNRYGILRRDWPAVECTVREGDEALTLATAQAEITIKRADGRLTLRDAAGRVLLQEALPPRSGEGGFGADFDLAAGERLYGLGDETRETIQKRGHRAQIWVTNVSCYVPIPYLMSSRGWAILLNSTWRHVWDVGQTHPDRLHFGGPRGELDYYLFTGPGLPALLDRYTDLAGKPYVMPRWGYGLTFVCNQQADAREMLDDCLNLRREGIPCDVIGLEPGWMEKRYDYTLDKKWHPERFYIAYWATKEPSTFLGAVKRLGFKMSLWLCCDYDLTYWEEKQLRAAEDAAPASPARHPDDFEVDDHFGMPDRRLDTVTRPDEPWFEHLKQFVDQGVSAFKLDGANQILGHPDRAWGNGRTDEEVHNLYPTLYVKQMNLGFKAHTGRRIMLYGAGGYVGVQQFAATWAGDTGGGPKPLVSMLNHGLSGHSNVSCDMDVFTPEGIHFGFLQAWAQVCSWAYWRHPWLLGEKLLPIFKAYAALRYRLLPYLYSAAHQAARTGLPIMRAMPLCYPDDPASDAQLNQYLLGDSLLVAAFTDRVHLPSGRWIDYWTGASYEGPQDLTVTWPADRGGPLFVRAGAILPFGPAMDHVDQKPETEIELHVWPEGESAFTLTEDDGSTFAYRDGALATTAISCHAAPGRVRLEIGPRRGEYAGMPAERRYEVRIHVAAAPRVVSVNGATAEWRWDATSQTICLQAAEDVARQKAVVVQCEW